MGTRARRQVLGFQQWPPLLFLLFDVLMGLAVALTQGCFGRCGGLAWEDWEPAGHGDWVPRPGCRTGAAQLGVILLVASGPSHITQNWSPKGLLSPLLGTPFPFQQRPFQAT